MPLISRSFVVSDEVPEELRRADRIVQSLTGASRRRTQGLFDGEIVRVNGELCVQPWRRLAPGETLQIEYDPQQPYSQKKKPPRYLGFEIAYEDEHLLVVNKPAGWLTVPSPKKERGTLVHRVSDYLTKRNRGRRLLVYPAHRLDRGASGLLVLGRSLEIAAALRKQFEARKPDRQYVAIVAGNVKPDKGTIQSYLTSDRSFRQYSTPDPEKGALAITHYEVERRFSDATWVRVWLETGRRNQIRVHFAEAGHPVLGDPRYAHEKAIHPKWTSSRIALHATRLGFEHPVTQQSLIFDAEPPAEFAEFSSKHS